MYQHSILLETEVCTVNRTVWQKGNCGMCFCFAGWRLAFCLTRTSATQCGVRGRQYAKLRLGKNHDTIALRGGFIFCTSIRYEISQGGWKKSGGRNSISFGRRSNSFVRCNMSRGGCSISFARCFISFVRDEISHGGCNMSRDRNSISFGRRSNSFVRWSKSFGWWNMSGGGCSISFFWWDLSAKRKGFLAEPPSITFYWLKIWILTCLLVCTLGLLPQISSLHTVSPRKLSELIRCLHHTGSYLLLSWRYCMML